MNYTLIITNTFDGKDFVKTRKRIDAAIDDFWFFVEDCPKQSIRILKEGTDITAEVMANKDLKSKYYKGLGL